MAFFLPDFVHYPRSKECLPMQRFLLNGLVVIVIGCPLVTLQHEWDDQIMSKLLLLGTAGRAFSPRLWGTHQWTSGTEQFGRLLFTTPNVLTPSRVFDFFNDSPLHSVDSGEFQLGLFGSSGIEIRGNRDSWMVDPHGQHRPWKDMGWSHNLTSNSHPLENMCVVFSYSIS